MERKASMPAAEEVPSDCVYTPCYCEENVFWLAKKKLQDQKEETETHAGLNVKYTVVVVSNPKQAVPLCHQRAAKEDEDVVVWDYHVFLLESNCKTNKATKVWDMDSKLEFGIKADEYFNRTFPFEEERLLAAGFDPVYLKLIDSEFYVKNFSSSREHMKVVSGNQADDDIKWLAQPPSYPCVLAEDGVSTFGKLFITEDDVKHEKCEFGKNYVLEQFQHEFL